VSEGRYAIVDTTTGEEIERSDSTPRQLEDTLVQTERQLRMANARVTRMQRDEEHEARKNKLWEEAETVHTWWRLATGHFGVKFTAEDFKHVAPRLKERGPIGVLRAIAGAAFDPGSTTMKNGRQMVYDDFELINRSRTKADNFAQRAPGSENSHEWKRWLLERIESNLRGKEEK
jgi:hypothetical protein